MRTTGRGFVVTGGTGALGREVVAALLRAGARVAVPYRGASGLDELKAATGGSGDLWAAVADVGDAEATRAFFREAVARLGRLDGVAALAGAWAGGATLEASPAAQWSEMLRVNLETAHHACRESLPHLLAGGGGGVVTVSSRLAESGGAGSAAYAVAKAGVLALTRALAAENRARGIRFNCVVPGIIDTEANRKAMPDADRSAWTPPAHVARVIAFLLATESSAITGAVIPV